MSVKNILPCYITESISDFHGPGTTFRKSFLSKPRKLKKKAIKG